ncbi:MAG TPA: hypothetical protein VFR90_02520 [Methylibium sp.]|uniref:hypothetical protein n=1 Tax=Methylibium sp. TaxID=2067992 RepID=UPI002DBFEA03|nr:hypothetical protein [Methylibium sp.]HEU4457977.1 hypothetical protein [Methylibium sp.]
MTAALPLVADPALDAAIDDVEARLAALAASLAEPGGRAIDTAATDLQRALAAALDRFQRSRGPVPPALRQRLARASASIAAQRETLARATAALDRAIEVLLPREGGTYNAQGAAAQARHSGLARA